MQIVCDRLYRKGKERARAGEPWKISAGDYETLGGLQGQIDAYLDEVLEAFCSRALGETDRSKIEHELGVWKDLLADLASVQYDGTATTKLVRVLELQERARALGCRVDFDTMMKHLQHDEQRILRPPVRIIDRATHETWDYSSLGHDAIALSLNRWRASRGVIQANGAERGRRSDPRLLDCPIGRRCGGLIAG